MNIEHANDVNTKKFFKEKSAYDKIIKESQKKLPSKKKQREIQSKTSQEKKREIKMRSKMNYVFEITPEQYKIQYVGTKKKDLIVPRSKKSQLSNIIDELSDENKNIKSSMIDTKYKLSYEIFNLAMAEDKINHLDSIQKTLDENEKKISNFKKVKQIEDLKMKETKKSIEARKKEIASEIKDLGPDGSSNQKRELIKEYQLKCKELYDLLCVSKNQGLYEIDLNMKYNTNSSRNRPVREVIEVEEEEEEDS